MTELEKLQAKPREKRTPLEQCVVDATTFEEAEHDGEIEIMLDAADILALLSTLLKKAKSVFNAADGSKDLLMAEKYIDAAVIALDGGK
jgi:hypothetical protein